MEEKGAVFIFRMLVFPNFLRLHIAKDGSLSIYPFKIESVPRDWKESGEGRRFKPGGGSRPELIEPPIVVR
jgi:hypothetical protein